MNIQRGFVWTARTILPSRSSLRHPCSSARAPATPWPCPHRYRIQNTHSVDVVVYPCTVHAQPCVSSASVLGITQRMTESIWTPGYEYKRYEWHLCQSKRFRCLFSYTCGDIKMRQRSSSSRIKAQCRTQSAKQYHKPCRYTTAQLIQHRAYNK